MQLKCYIDSESLESNIQNIDLELMAKNTNVLDFLFRDTLEQAIDITGATLFVTFKNKTSDTDDSAVLKKTITSFDNPSGGQTDVILTSTDTSSLLGNYLWDAKIKMSDGKIYTLAQGTACFRLSLTIRES
jgi:prolyl oligopeptidase PreP (S9A serine peptidase family)